MVRRIASIDFETTGAAPPDAAPCEVGETRVIAYSTDIAEQPSGWHVGYCESKLVNPGHPITAETAAIHHILDPDVRGARPWADEIRELGRRDDIDAFAAHSMSAERQWLTDELTGGKPWICTYRCALRLWPDAPAHGLQVLRYWIFPKGMERDKGLPAHRAGPDSYIAACLLVEMLQLTTVEQLIAWSSVPALLSRWPFGAHRGTPVQEIETSLLEWTLRKDFGEDIIFTAQTELDRREEEWRKQQAESANA